MKVYGLRIYEKVDGKYVLMKNYMPCLNGGVAGFEDTCTGKYYPPSSGKLRYGGDIMRYDSYIESDGDLRLNTGYFVGANTKLELDFQLGDNPSGNPALLGVLNHDEAYGTNEVNLTVYLGGSSGSRWLNVIGRSSNGDESNANLCRIDGNRHTLVVDLPSKDGSGHPYDQFRLFDENGDMEYNSGSTVRNWVTNALVTAEDAVAGLPLGLFARCDTKWACVQSDFTMAGAAQMKVYGLRIYEKEGDSYVLKKDFVPCLKGSSAEGPTAGFKDTVSGVFNTGVRTDTVYYGGDIMVEKDDPYVSTERNDVVAGPVVGGSIELDTKYRMKTNSRVELDFAPLTPRWTGSASYGNHSASFLAAYNDTAAYPNICAGAGSGYIVCRLGTSGYTNLVKLEDAYGIRRTISMSSNTIAMVTSGFTNVVVTVPHGTGIEQDVTKTMTIGSYRGSSEFAPMKIYGLKIYESDVLVRDYRPIVTNGVPWLQDALNPETLCGPDTYGGGSRTNIVMEAGGNFVCTDGSDEAYLELSGVDKWIQTDCRITKDSRIEADFSLWKTGNAQYQQQFFLQESSSGGIFAKLWISSDNNVYKIAYAFRDHVNGDNGGTATSIAPANERRQYVLDGPNGRVMIKRGDEVLYDEAMQGTRSNTGGTTKLKIGNYNCCMRLYGLRVTTGGELAGDFMPYVTNGVAGLYDLVGKKFYPRMSDATPSEPVGKVGGMRSRDIDGDPATYQVEVPPAAAAARRGPLYSTNLVCKAAGAQYYQWFKDGVLIPGATTDTYTVTWERAAPPDHVINYSVRPVYSVFNETVYGEEDTTSITNLPAGFTTAFK